ncbi:MAG: hypothetical protein ACO4BJ_06825 [Planctomycetota bacterium]|jgi:hypothetical protein
MKRRPFMALLASALVVAMALPASAGSNVGDKAPELSPQGYLNAKEPITWAGLQGKLVLIEKWATW